MNDLNNPSRRKFIQTIATTTGLGALGLGSQQAQATTPALNLAKYKTLIPELFLPLPSPPTHSTCLVIGSGFGGSISALRLAQAGQQVTVLERGYKWPNDPWRNIFSNDTIPDGRAFWHKNKAKMLTDLPRTSIILAALWMRLNLTI